MVMEIWKPLADMPYYEVSNMGRLRSYLPRHKYGGRFGVTPHAITKVKSGTNRRIS